VLATARAYDLDARRARAERIPDAAAEPNALTLDREADLLIGVVERAFDM